MKNGPATAARPPASRAHARGRKRPPAPLVLQPERATKAFVIGVCVVLALATLAVYFRTFGYGYIAYDDDTYVYGNPVVKAGLSLANFAWAFTTFNSANWHPLTWLSYMLDCQLFGLNPGAEHAVNVAWHIAAAIVLFLALLRLTQARWRSALVAAIFALHPLHVESVAWIAERKDVLCTFFGMLTLLLYARYVEDRKFTRYAAVALAFALSLLAKPMAVTLPFVLLLLDFWPLRRVEWSKPRQWLPLVLEKFPLFAMVAASSALTFVAQQRSGTVVSLTQLSFTGRLSNVIVAYAAYIGKTFWPANLAVLYPIHSLSLVVVLGAALLLVAVTAAALRRVKRYPYLLMGWLWYLGTLVPVIGIVKVGEQAMADRYSYFPMVGLSIALIWTIASLLENHADLRMAATSAGAFILAILAVGTYHQAGFWKNSESLFGHALSVTTGNYIIENNLAIALAAQDRKTEAAALYRRAIKDSPDYADARNNLGVMLAAQGKDAEATELYRQAVALSPGYADAHTNLGAELAKQGNFEEAYGHLLEATQLKPDSAASQGILGAILAARGRYDEAYTHLLIATQLKPDWAASQDVFGMVLAERGQFNQAREHLQRSAQIEPRRVETWSHLCFVLQHLGRFEDAIMACNRALTLDPNSPEARLNLGLVFASQGKKEAAAAEYSRVLAADPNNGAARAALDRLKSAGR